MSLATAAWYWQRACANSVCGASAAPGPRPPRTRPRASALRPRSRRSQARLREGARRPPRAGNPGGRLARSPGPRAGSLKHRHIPSPVGPVGTPVSPCPARPSGAPANHGQTLREAEGRSEGRGSEGVRAVEGGRLEPRGVRNA
eukprot:12221433-Alexandrium_andersonii.AAC.1